MSSPRGPVDRESSAAVGVLALVVAVVVALTGTWSARPDEPERSVARVRVGVFDRTRLDAGVAAGAGLERALAGIGEAERLAWIGERPVAPAWRADDVEVVDVTDAIRAEFAANEPPPPEVICEMVNPQTKEHVRLFKEIGLEVLPDHDERKHVEQWRDEQIARGFTVEVKR